MLIQCSQLTCLHVHLEKMAAVDPGNVSFISKARPVVIAARSYLAVGPSSTRRLFCLSVSQFEQAFNPRAFRKYAAVYEGQVRENPSVFYARSVLLSLSPLPVSISLPPRSAGDPASSYVRSSILGCRRLHPMLWCELVHGILLKGGRCSGQACDRLPNDTRANYIHDHRRKKLMCDL